MGTKQFGFFLSDFHHVPSGFFRAVWIDGSFVRCQRALARFFWLLVHGHVQGSFGGILTTNISRISGRFLGDDSQYVGLGRARIDNCLLLTAFSRACPFGLVVGQPHDWCSAFKSPPMMKYCLRPLKKFSNCVCVILCFGGHCSLEEAFIYTRKGGEFDTRANYFLLGHLCLATLSSNNLKVLLTMFWIIFFKDLFFIIKKKKYCASTCDLWTDNFYRNSYMPISLHYIDDNWELNNRLLHTGQFQMNELKTANKPSSNDLMSSITFVADQGRNMLSALRNTNRLNCRYYSLNTVLRNLFDMKYLEQEEDGNKPLEPILTLLTECKQLERFMKSSSFSIEI
ncbi:hypothetical protein AGLY_014068 [Aphis glycines]|uniref:Uncharacterized protein n=1 Tax=Aphis glycines TaxID=307491 RepID=A0A6G0T598_APHGL|nr:hypothetical protein AGLY_014068 [Aphis glycines]